MKDFFISYNREDREWAEWIAWQLEEERFTAVIQAWDFVAGNWVVGMNSAMGETERTIAVLSPNYVKAVYTQSEWANAFRLDPTGEKDLLIPVRVAAFEPDGIFAQLVYVDLVGAEEAAAVERLLKRVRGERAKPSTRPTYPSSQSAAPLHPPSRAAKPIYPAFDQDTQRLIRAREILVAWRSRYAGQEEALRSAARKARAWSRQVPEQFDDEMSGVLDLAARVARDFESTPLAGLEFAKAYGLMVHETVFWGQAMITVAVTHESYGPGRSDARKLLDEDQEKHGLPVDKVPDKYAFEMMARVLESADALTRFKFDALPRGFIAGAEPAGDLRSYQTLVIARIDDDPRLHLMSVDAAPRTLGTFAARRLSLYPHCARRNLEGTVDLVARDSEHVYRWFASSQQPSTQYPRESIVLQAGFVSSAPQADVVTIHGDGIRLLRPDGEMDILLKSPDVDFRAGAVWIDPLKPEQWHAFALTDKLDLVARSADGPAEGRSGNTLWQDADFLGAPPRGIFWEGNAGLAVHELDGLPCLVATQQAAGGEAVQFLDPLTLASIRRPLFISGFVGEVIIAGGRWLAAFFMQRGTSRLSRAAIWDLRTESADPIARCYERLGDVYHPFVTKQTETAFEALFVLRELEGDQDRYLCRFRWPAEAVEELGKYSDLRILPVSEAIAGTR